MKKLLFIPVAILLLTGCNKQAETQNVERPETPQVVTPEQQPEENMEENTDILYNEDGSIDTSNWETYTNEEYGFSVKYPAGWVKLSWNSDKTIVFTDKEPQGEYVIALDATKNSWKSFDERYEEVKKLKEEVNNIPAGQPVTPIDVPTKSDLTILGGIQAEKIFTALPVNGGITTWVSYQFKNKGIYYKVSLLDGYGGYSEESELVLDGIVNSIEFL